MRRKHKKNDFFFRKNSKEIKKEDTAMDFSKLDELTANVISEIENRA